MKNIISYSLHVGKGENRIINKNNLMKTMFHNLRYYTKQNLENKIYDKDNVYILKGTKDLFNDVKELYFEEFESVRIDYNNKQKRKDRMIKDYFEYINNNDQKDLAVEMIIQIGHKDFYDKHGFKDKKDEFVKLYQKEIEKLETHLPNFKIANAVIHFDEASPHIQIVGIPIANNLKRGMSKQISKSEVFNKESLIKLQEVMRIGVEDDFKKIYGNVSLKPREKGRNHDFTVKEYGRLMDQVKDKYNTSIQNIENGIKDKTNELSNINSKIEDKKDELNDIKSQMKSIETKIDSKNSELNNKNTELNNKNKELNNIQSQIENTRKQLKDVENLKDNQDELKTEIDNLNNEKQDLINQVERTKNQLKNLKDEEEETKERIKKEKSELKGIEILKSVNESLIDQVQMFNDIEEDFLNDVYENEKINIENSYLNKKEQILEGKDDKNIYNIIPKLNLLFKNLTNHMLKFMCEITNKNYYYR